ncbi:MAG: TIGR00153 family protein [Pseudomonadota bacterium]|nr:TIGR00153 family protein [Pseudomonadota bacterium]
MSSIFNVFSSSPFGLLSDHMKEVLSATEHLEAFFVAVMQEDWEKVQELRKIIALKEADADVVKKKIFLRMHRDIFLPVARADLLALVRSQDSIANQAKDISGITYGRRIVFPKSVHSLLTEFIRSAIDACLQAKHIVAELEKLLKGSFSQNKVKLVEKMIEDIDVLEHANDERQIELREELLGIESEMSPIDAIFMYKILEMIGQLADNAHHVGAKFLLFLPSSR